MSSKVVVERKSKKIIKKGRRSISDKTIARMLFWWSMTDGVANQVSLKLQEEGIKVSRKVIIQIANREHFDSKALVMRDTLLGVSKGSAETTSAIRIGKKRLMNMGLSLIEIDEYILEQSRRFFKNNRSVFLNAKEALESLKYVTEGISSLLGEKDPKGAAIQHAAKLLTDRYAADIKDIMASLDPETKQELVDKVTSGVIEGSYAHID